MKIYLFIIIAICTSACSKSVPDKAHTREIFDAGGEQVITSFANRKLQTMSVLYGNGAAKKSALSGYRTHTIGEEFTLVIYKQAANKYWYGSYINGAVKSIEKLSLPRNTEEFTYTLKGQAPADSLGKPAAVADRARNILSHQPSVFP